MVSIEALNIFSDSEDEGESDAEHEFEVNHSEDNGNGNTNNQSVDDDIVQEYDVSANGLEN